MSEQNFIDFTLGDILVGKKTVHPIIFLNKENADTFVGCMVTHSNRYPNNIHLKSEHFLDKDETGKGYKVIFSKSLVLKLQLLKKADWGPFELCGRLSPEGVDFIKQMTSQKKPTYFGEYIRS